MKIIIKKPNEDQLKELDTESWSQWECEPSVFDWKYAEEETALVLEGRVRVTTEWESVNIKKGDLVTFPKNLECKWEVIEHIRKVYKFNT